MGEKKLKKKVFEWGILIHRSLFRLHPSIKKYE